MHANLYAQDVHYRKTQPTSVKITELKVASDLDSLLLIWNSAAKIFFKNLRQVTICHKW